jgi:hypothetical protein
LSFCKSVTSDLGGLGTFIFFLADFDDGEDDDFVARLRVLFADEEMEAFLNVEADLLCWWFGMTPTKRKRVQLRVQYE